MSRSWLLVICLLSVTLLAAGGCTAWEEARLRGRTVPGVVTDMLYAADAGRGVIVAATQEAGLGGAREFWSGETAWEIPASRRALFPGAGLSECKPAVWRGTRVVLVTVAPTGFAVLRAADARVLFHAEALPEARSAEALPEGALVTASARGLRVYSTEADYTADYALEGAAGVVWDRGNRCLWALGSGALYCYSYNMDAVAPALSLVETIELPGGPGRDLYPRAWSNEMLVVTGAGTWTLDTRTRVWSRFMPLAGVEGVLSAGERRSGGRVVYALGDERILLANPAGESAAAGARITRVRWDRLPELTYGYDSRAATASGLPVATVTTGR